MVMISPHQNKLNLRITELLCLRTSCAKLLKLIAHPQERGITQFPIIASIYSLSMIARVESGQNVVVVLQVWQSQGHVQRVGRVV